jgi:hypothetical protein
MSRAHFNKALPRMLSSSGYTTVLIGQEVIGSKELEKQLYSLHLGASITEVDELTDVAVKWFEEHLSSQTENDIFVHISYPELASSISEMSAVESIDRAVGRLNTLTAHISSVLIITSLTGYTTPLWIKWDMISRKGRQVDDILSCIDIYPTILKLVDQTQPPESQGLSFYETLLFSKEPIRKVAVYFEEQHKFRLISQTIELEYDILIGKSRLTAKMDGWFEKDAHARLEGALSRALLRWRSRQDYLSMIREQIVGRPAEGRSAKLARAAGVSTSAKLNKQGQPRKSRVVDSAYELTLRVKGIDAEKDLQADFIEVLSLKHALA